MSAATTVSSVALGIGTNEGRSSVELLTNPEEVVPPLKHRCLLRLGAVGPLPRVHVDEPVFRVVDVTEPSSSNTVSLDLSPTV